MKNKTLKKTLLISTGLLAAGGICIGIGIAMGGSPVFYLDNDIFTPLSSDDRSFFIQSSGLCAVSVTSPCESRLVRLCRVICIGVQALT